MNIMFVWRTYLLQIYLFDEIMAEFINKQINVDIPIQTNVDVVSIRKSNKVANAKM